MKLRMLRMQQSVDTLNKLFAETAGLSGHLTQFPEATDQPHPMAPADDGAFDPAKDHYLPPYPTLWGAKRAIDQCREAIIQTLGIVQMICRVMLEETGEIKPLDIPEARSVSFSIGKHGGVTFAIVCADAAPQLIGAVDIHEFADGTVPLVAIAEAIRRNLPRASINCDRLRIISEIGE